VDLYHFYLLRAVGKGAFGKVRVVQHKQTKVRHVASQRGRAGLRHADALLDGRIFMRSSTSTRPSASRCGQSATSSRSGVC
jgi:hypothetical protein